VTGRTRRPLVGLLAAEVVSATGTRMSMVALPWFVLTLTGSPARTGLVAAAEMLPYVLASGLGGPLLDRIGVRRVSVVADVGSALAVAAIPVLFRDGMLSFPALIGLVAVVGLLRGVGDMSKQALFPRTVAGSGVELTRATSLHDGLRRLATLLGAPLAGVLIAVLGAPTVLLLDAGTFAAGAVLVAACVPAGLNHARATDPADTATRSEAASGRGSYLAALREAGRFYRNDRLLIAIAVMLTATNLFDQAYTAVLAPVWARQVAGDATALGLLFGAFGVGAVAGNAVFIAVAPRVNRWAVFAVGFLVVGAPRHLATALFGERLWVMYLVSFVAGVAIAAVNPILGAVFYERVPQRLQARVLGLSHAVSWAGIPMGGLAGGALVQWVGLEPSLYVFGACYLAVTLLPFLDRSWRALNDRPGSGNVIAEPAAGDPAGGAPGSLGDDRAPQATGLAADDRPRRPAGASG
jgi:MFS family permease